MADSDELAQMIHSLSPDQQREVEAFVRQLMTQQTEEEPYQLKLNWRGALSHLDKSSVDVQHETLDLWGD